MVVTSSDFCVAIIIIATSTTLQVVELVSIQLCSSFWSDVNAFRQAIESAPHWAVKVQHVQFFWYLFAAVEQCSAVQCSVACIGRVTLCSSHVKSPYCTKADVSVACASG
eukprot:3140-Heterococcus_DN1.PRE.2